MDGWKTACESDPFLKAHQGSSPRTIDIGGGLSPLGIRDQMFRAAVAVDRAFHHGLIGPANPLIVAGGSAAGVTAATRAARKGVPVTVIEEKSNLFFRQHECDTRFVSPTQYDWPAPQAGQHRYPWNAKHPPVELEWPDALSPASALAEKWLGILLADQRAYSAKLQVLLETRYVAVAPLPGERIIVVTDPWRGLPAASLLILATGLGKERCSVDGHSGFEFWDNDPFLEPNLGCVKPPRVVISGAGDGALQDFIRIVTGSRCAMDFYEWLPWESTEQRLNLERAVWAAEDQFDRAMVWSTREWDCQLLTRLHEEIVAQVEDLGDGFWRRLREGFKREPERMRVGRDVRSLRFVHPCQHFAKCYALNHFLVALLCRYLGAEESESRVVGVSSTVCGGSGCHGLPHRLKVRRGVTCANKEGGGFGMRTADVMVLRHGLEGPGAEIRQTVPSYMPW